MKYGFVKVAAVACDIAVADCVQNQETIKKGIVEASTKGAKIIVFPELCVTGYSCGDLFFQNVLKNGALSALENIVKYSTDFDAIIFVGCPIRFRNKLYNCAVAICRGRILGIVPKSHLPNYNEFYEKRQFAAAPNETYEITICGQSTFFGKNLLFGCSSRDNIIVGAEICEDLWTPNPPSDRAVTAGATIIVNLSASNEIVGKSAYRKELVKTQSARCVCGYVYCSAGYGESTTDVVYSGHSIISENGKVLAESELFENQVVLSEIDVDFLSDERMKIFPEEETRDFKIIDFELNDCDTVLTRSFNRTPFVPKNEGELSSVADLISKMQCEALKKRIDHTKTNSLVVGLSGGLDSALALIATKIAATASVKKPEVIAVTMPCFGTSKRTYRNSVDLATSMGVTIKEISIKKAVMQHFEDIGQDGNVYDVTYENAQARERTQVLMDIANKTGGMVIGTGDLSELALGWATYNGDHMSMYGINASIPKTLVRYLVRHYALKADEKTKEVLFDILDTPVSPELLPLDGEESSQKTEDLVGPYELHDFFLYYILRTYYSPKKVFYIAKQTFSDYSETEILKWLETFIRRFFAQQFKRSCLPDGVKVGSVALSPRGDWRMPSDACSTLWMQEIAELKSNLHV